MTVLDLIASSMRDVGSLAQGELPNADEANVCLQKLNNMLDRWSLERLNLFTVGATIYNLTPNKQTYTVGVGAADFNSPRPVRIQTSAAIMPGTTVRVSMDLMTSVEWAALREKGSSGLLPAGLYCDYDSPIARLNITPVPTGAISIEVYGWTALTQFTTLQDVINFPLGYLEALEFNLAVRIAPEFGMQLDPVIVAAAADGKQSIQRFNAMVLTGAKSEESTGKIPSIGATIPMQEVQGQQ
jgi:hypothetical protein